MWAHYSDEFAGICVAYRFARLREALSDEVTFSRVSYADKPPKMSKPDGKHARVRTH
ncbi:MAG: DUF2971 domain-containing protein [Pseudaminobacter sp.]|nr:DUF2971 domain-containing protein [Pseudaminobacter sp.]